MAPIENNKESNSVPSRLPRRRRIKQVSKVKETVIESPPSTKNSKSCDNDNNACSHKQELDSTAEKLKAVQQFNEKLKGELEAEKLAHQRDFYFTKNLLYTLNQRGYLSLTDQNGVVVDLSRCKGDSLLQIKGRDQKQRNTRRAWGPELYYKSIIGNQEKSIQTLSSHLEAVQRESEEGTTRSPGEGLLTLLEATCEAYPDVYYILRDQQTQLLDKSEKTNPSKSSSLRAMTISSSGREAVEKVLERCRARAALGRNHKNLKTVEMNAVIDATRSQSTSNIPTNENVRSVELMDFEKFIGAAVLQLRDRGGNKDTTLPSSSTSSSAVSKSVPSSEYFTSAVSYNSSSSNFVEGKRNRRSVNKSTNKMGKVDGIINSGHELTSTNSPLGISGSLNNRNLLLPTSSGGDGDRRPHSDGLCGPHRPHPTNLRPLSPLKTRNGHKSPPIRFFNAELNIGKIETKINSPSSRRRSTEERGHKEQGEEALRATTKTTPRNVPLAEYCRPVAVVSCPYCLKVFDKASSPEEVKKHLESHLESQSTT